MPRIKEVVESYVNSKCKSIGIQNPVTFEVEQLINPTSFQLIIKVYGLHATDPKDQFILELYGRRRLQVELTVPLADLQTMYEYDIDLNPREWTIDLESD